MSIEGALLNLRNEIHLDSSARLHESHKMQVEVLRGEIAALKAEVEKLQGELYRVKKPKKRRRAVK